MRQWILLCLLLFACTQQPALQDIPEPVALVEPSEATLPEPEEPTPPQAVPPPKLVEQPVVGETVEEFVEDKAECWKDSDCGQDCASNYIMNVYKCDLSRHACVPGYKQPYNTVQCEQEYGYGFRCRVGKCVRGS